MGFCFTGYVLNQRPLYGTFPPTVRIHLNQGMAVGVSLSLCGFFFPYLKTLTAAGVEILVPKGRIFPSGDAMVPLNWKMRLSAGHLGFLIPLKQKAKTG